MAMLSIGTSVNALVDIHPDPAELSWGIQDISASDAGRVQDAGNTMYKMRTAQKRKLTVTWNFPTAAQAAAILQAVNPEYFFVKYFDAMENAWNIREFYVGDRSAPFKWFNLGSKGTRFSQLTFDLVER